ncbi:unnamed protein product [Rhodiola kirilowii]
MDPELIKDVLNRINDFHKPQRNPSSLLVVEGLATYEGKKWAKHRKLVNPAFHFEKLKSMIPKFYHSGNEMVSNWEKLALASADGSFVVAGSSFSYTSQQQVVQGLQW